MLTKNNHRIKEFYEAEVKKMKPRAKRLLVEQLKKELGVTTKQAFLNIKNGKTSLSIPQAIVWSNFLGKSLDELFKNEESSSS